MEAALRRVEEVAGGFALGEDEAAYPHRRALYDSRFIVYGTLTASENACHGSRSCAGLGAAIHRPRLPQLRCLTCAYVLLRARTVCSLLRRRACSFYSWWSTDAWKSVDC
jgi:hypothetical protein